MYSSTVSSAATIPHDKSSATVSTGRIESLCRNRPFYEPNEEFDGSYIYKLYENPIFGKQKAQKQSKRKPTDCGPFCGKERKNEDQAINYWMENVFKFDKRSFVQTIQEDGKDKIRKNKEVWLKLGERGLPWYAPNWKHISKLPYIERYFNYPALVISLGHTFTHYKILQKYIEHGYQLFYIDGRFGTCEQYYKTLEHINYVRKVALKRVFFQSIYGVAFEITGRNLRTGIVYNNTPVFIERDSKVIITADRRFGSRSSNRVIYVNIYDYLELLQVCDKIKIGDKIELIIYEKRNISLVCRVLHEGLLESRLQVTVPIQYSVTASISVTHEEEVDIDLAFKLGVDFIVCSCIYYAKLVQHIYWTMAGANREMKIIARIDLSRLLVKKTIDYIIKTCYGVMLDSVRILEENLAMREYLIRECYLKNKIILRINCLDTNNIRDLPSDEESLKQIFLYPDAIIINPKLVPTTKVKPLIVKAYSQMNRENLKLSMTHWFQRGTCNAENVFTHYVMASALSVRATCIIIINNNGRAVQALSRRRPLVPIIASFTDIQSARGTTMLRNVYRLLYYNPRPIPWHDELDIRLNCCIEYAKTIGCMIKQHPFIFVFDTARAMSFTDTYRILQLNE